MNRYFGTSGFSLWLFVAFITSAQSIASLNPDPYQITHGEFQKHCQILEFNSQQLASAREMFDAHTMDFDRTCEAYLTIDSWAHANSGSSLGIGLYSPDFSNKVYADRLMLDRKFHVALQELEERYFHGLSSILDKQSDNVDNLATHHLRQRIIGHRDRRLDPDTYGASLDLASILHSPQFRQVVDQDVDIKRILKQYTLELDGILRALDKISPNYKRDARVELRGLRDKALSNITIEPNEIQHMAEQFACTQDYSQQIRNLNKRIAIRFAELLPSKLSDDFTSQINKSLYAYIYTDRPNCTQILIKARRNLSSQSLNNELVEALQTLMDAEQNAISYVEPLYDEMLSPANRKAAWESWVESFIEGVGRPFEDPRVAIVARYKTSLLRYKTILQPIDQLTLRLLEKSNMQIDQEGGG